MPRPRTYNGMVEKERAYREANGREIYRPDQSVLRVTVTRLHFMGSLRGALRDGNCIFINGKPHEVISRHKEQPDD